MRFFISMLCATVLHTFVQYEKCDASSSATSQECFPVHHMTCAWEVGDGKIVNLAPLIYSSTERIERGFVVNGKPDGKYHQYYSYAYNPCRWISLAGDCDRDKETAICQWTPYNDNPDNYRSIGNKMPKCTKVSNGIRLIYNAGGRYPLKPIVKVKCNRTKADIKDATFKVINESDWVFELDHLCGCGTAAKEYLKLKESQKAYIIVEIVVPTAGVIALVVGAGLFLWWKKRGNRRRNNNNPQENYEGQPLHQDDSGQDGLHILWNVFYGSNSKTRSGIVAPPRSKNDNLRS
ncbi:uncharacterized protein [Pocillopora verrucosa]|uniref:uncharacterized protein n=1 Tax=Pocillopora verrucosa TaxID=203993 RepID=UPI00333FA655